MWFETRYLVSYISKRIRTLIGMFRGQTVPGMMDWHTATNFSGSSGENAIRLKTPDFRWIKTWRQRSQLSIFIPQVKPLPSAKKGWADFDAPDFADGNDDSVKKHPRLEFQPVRVDTVFLPQAFGRPF